MPTNLPNQPYPQLKTAVWANQQTYDASCIGGNFSQGESSATQVWNVARSGLDDFITGVLGYSLVGKGQIARFLPARHPSSFSLYASRVSNIQGIASSGQIQNANGVDADWECYRVTIQYDTPPYQVLDDASVGRPGAVGSFDEWKRYVIWNVEPNVEFIQRLNGAFFYPVDVPNIQTKYRKIVGNYGQTVRLVKLKIVGNWIQVPDNYLFTGGSLESLYAPKQLNGLGKVNNDIALGTYPAGTLRFDGFKPHPKVMPVPVARANALATVPLAWDVEMCFTYFNPPTDPGYTYPTDGKGSGHNLVPHPTYQYWYPAYLNNNSSWPRYETYDFDLLWEGNT